MCTVDPVPSKRFKENLPIIGSVTLDLTVAGHVRTFKTAAMKPLLKRTSLDPDKVAFMFWSETVLMNYLATYASAPTRV